MKYSEIIRRVRQTAGDINVLQFSDAMLVDWINDGVRECAIENNLLQKTATTNSQVGVQIYNLPTDILKLYSVTYDGEKLRVLTYQEWEELSAGVPTSTPPPVGPPQQCFVWAGKLNFYPPPTKIASFSVNYIYDPPDSAGADLTATVPLPVSYHLRLVTYCLAQVALQDDDTEKYAIFMGQFRSGVIDLQQQGNQEEALYPFMSVATRDMGEWPGTGEWY